MILQGRRRLLTHSSGGMDWMLHDDGWTKNNLHGSRLLGWIIHSPPDTVYTRFNVFVTNVFFLCLRWFLVYYNMWVFPTRSSPELYLKWVESDKSRQGIRSLWGCLGHLHAGGSLLIEHDFVLGKNLSKNSLVDFFFIVACPNSLGIPERHVHSLVVGHAWTGPS
jgi:hypothetical protein